MFGVPFCGFFPLIFFDSDFDLPQHRLAPQADRRTQLRDGVLGVEVKNAQEILMFKVVFRLQAAAGHEGVCDADGGGVSELRSDVELIILLQKAAVNDAEDVLLVIVPIFRRKLGGDLLKLFHEVAPGHVKPLLQRRRYRVLIFLPVLPQLGPGFLSAAGVSHIEHIAQKGPAAAVVDDGDARGPPDAHTGASADSRNHIPRRRWRWAAGRESGAARGTDISKVVVKGEFEIFAFGRGEERKRIADSPLYSVLGRS